jgi:transposase
MESERETEGTHSGSPTGTSCNPIGVITQIERRRRWSDEEKLAILAEAAAPGISVNEVCRRHNISSGLFYKWREGHRDGRLGQSGDGLLSFFQVQVAPDRRSPFGSLPAAGLIEIELPGGCRVRVDAAVDGAALRRVLTALGR